MYIYIYIFTHTYIYIHISDHLGLSYGFKSSYAGEPGALELGLLEAKLLGC